MKFNHLLAFAGCSFLVAALAGCSKSAAPEKSHLEREGTHNHEDHSGHDDDHSPGAGPHGGLIVDWGGGAYHVEFTVDHDKKEAKVYLLGSDEKSPAPISSESIKLFLDEPLTEIELTAKPLEGEAAGKSSRFVGVHKTLGIVKELSGTITGVIDETPYTGDFDEELHSGHNH